MGEHGYGRSAVLVIDSLVAAMFAGSRFLPSLLALRPTAVALAVADRVPCALNQPRSIRVRVGSD